MQDKQSFIFFISHPIQYYSPLFREMAKVENWDFEVWYCSDENIKGHLDRGFNTQVKWDVDLLSGYKYKILKNNSPWPSIFNGFKGLINLDAIKLLRQKKKAVIVVHGWAYASNILVIIAAKLFGHTVLLRGENPLKQEVSRSKGKRIIKKYYLKTIFSFVDHFLFIGKQNKLFYQSYGVNEKKLAFTPYAVDNERFQENAKQYLPQKSSLRKILGVPEDAFVILYSGKYIDKKRPLDLLKAFHMLNENNAWLVMIGEGTLRDKMEVFIEENNMDRIILTGFINQTEIPKYYAIGDVFVMCSEYGETWGLSVNEAMNFSLPVIASDLVGCTDDLIENDKNGYVYPHEDITRLSMRLRDIIDLKNRETFGNASLQKIKQYSYNVIIDNIRSLIAKTN